jgi:pimeloyl-ACP methyl ester carboxylesterase
VLRVVSIDPRFLPVPPPPAWLPYRSLDGLALRARLWTGKRQRRALTVVSPGFAQHHGNRVFQRVAAMILARRDVLGVDYRGMAGQPGRYTFGAREQQDLIPLLDWACRRYADVELLGFSMGAIIALRALAEHPAKVRRLYFVSGPTSLEGVLLSGGPLLQSLNLLSHPSQLALRASAQTQPWCRYGWPLFPKPRGRDLAARLAVPVSFLVGGRDWLVLPRLTRALHDAVTVRRQWTEFPDGQHAEYMAVLQPKAFLAWMAAFRKTAR